MEPSRILLAGLPRFLRETLRRTFDKDPKLRVVGEVNNLADLSAAIADTQARWVILLLLPEGTMPQLIELLLAEYPAVRFLAVANDGSHVKARWSEPHERTLDGLSLSELHAVLCEEHPETVRIQADLTRPQV